MENDENENLIYREFHGR